MSARIDPDDLAEAVGNLLENASRHAGGSVAISAGRNGSLVTIRVADDGPGIPADRLEEVLARGGRLDEASDGAGLGLAIVQTSPRPGPGASSSSGPGLEAELSLPA